jgi:enterochelin esterase-like enzyme
MKDRVFISSIVFVIFSLLAQSQSSHAQSTCEQSSGHIERHSYTAQAIAAEMFYTIYLPPCYEEATQSYPILYLMHGSNTDDNHWLNLGLAEALDTGISSGNTPPLIVVLPFGNWVANENQFGTGSWGDIFLHQLMPLVERSYRVDGSADKRAIGGISRGGFWAFHLALRNPYLFNSVGGHSAFFDEYHAPEAYNPLDLALYAPGIESLRIWLDLGANDYAIDGLELMHNQLERRNLPHSYTIYAEGHHDDLYWSQHINDYLDFYTAEWKTDLQPLVEASPSPPPTQETITDPDGTYLFLPVVAFPSIQANIDAGRLQSIRAGLLDTVLVLGEDAAALLNQFGIPIPEGANIIPTADVPAALWRDHALFTLLPFDQLSPRYRVLLVDEQHPLDSDLSTYAFAFPSDTPNYHPERLMRFLLSGVTALTRNTRTALDNNGTDWATEAIAPYTSQADFFHTSNEVSIYPTCPETDGPMFGGSIMSFCSKEEHFDVLLNLDVDIVELSGNHNNDYGYDAYGDTLAWYSEHGIATVGGGETIDHARTPLVITHNNNQVAMISCNWAGPYFALVNENPLSQGGARPGAAFCDYDWLSELLPRLARENDLVIITVQYTEFDQYTPTERQQQDFRLLASLGADIVIGTQSHFPQTMEFMPRNNNEAAFIHYGLGNLFFDQQFFGGRRFFMDELFIYEGRLLTINLFTGIIEEQGRPRPMTPEERENFLFMLLSQYGDL